MSRSILTLNNSDCGPEVEALAVSLKVGKAVPSKK